MLGPGASSNDGSLPTKEKLGILEEFLSGLCRVFFCLCYMAQQQNFLVFVLFRQKNRKKEEKHLNCVYASQHQCFFFSLTENRQEDVVFRTPSKRVQRQIYSLFKKKVIENTEEGILDCMQNQ
jgi:hypothetical protein